jgi:hypothetical protein
MGLAVFQSAMQLQPREEQRRQHDSGFVVSRDAHRAAINAVVIVIAACEGYDDAFSMLQSCPAASELAQMPEFVSCLAIMAVATALGVDTSSDGSISATAMPDGRAESSSSRVDSSTSRRVPGAGRQQQPTQQAGSGSDSGGARSSASSSGGAGSSGSATRSAGSSSSAIRGASSSGSAGNSDGGLSNGVRPGSLTPLSCCLFDILGVTKETALLFARLVGSSYALTSPSQLHGLLKVYNSVIEYQVSVYVYV